MIKGILIGFVCFLLFLSHIIILHHFSIKRRFFTMCRVFFSMLLIYTVLFAMIPEGRIQKSVSFFIPITLFAFLNGTFLLYFCYFFYLHFIEIIDRSTATKIMVDIENSPGKKLTLSQIRELYSVNKKVSYELEDMIILGSLKKESIFYVITEKGKRHARIFKFIRDYMKLSRG